MNHELRQKIVRNRKLAELENQGFQRGDRRKKSMDVDEFAVMQSLEKQIKDTIREWQCYYVTVMPSLKANHREELEKCLADLRNVAGCLFLKLKVARKGT